VRAPFRYALHGLVIQSEVPLDAPIVDAPFDCLLELARTRSIDDSVPQGDLISYYDENGRRLVSVTATKGGYSMRYHGFVEAKVSADVSTVTVVADPHAPPGADAMVASSGLASLLACLRGACVLHASAFACESQGAAAAVAVAGSSGWGKSTLAALACAAGACLVTDDALRVEVNAAGAICHRGTRSLRLRSAASTLAGLFATDATGTSPDGRTVVELGCDNVSGTLPLAAVVVPATGSAGTVRLGPFEALEALLPQSRLANLTDPAMLEAHFRTCASLARCVPVFRVGLEGRYWESKELGTSLAELAWLA
jgi:hypothetical protein